MSARDDLRLLDFPDAQYSNGLHPVVNGNGLLRWARQAGVDTPDVYLSYRPADNGRAAISAAWQVNSLSHRTDPDAHWRDYGTKTFTVPYRGDRNATLEQAQTWTEGRYGITEWAKMPGLPGYLFPKALVDAAKAAIRQAKRDAKKVQA
jgi:hypothetical protein